MLFVLIYVCLCVLIGMLCEFVYSFRCLFVYVQKILALLVAAVVYINDNNN